MTIRLSGIDAPEQAQPFASVSRRNLLRLLGDHALEVRVAKYDQYGRAVAQVFVSADDGPVDVGLQQLQAGLAWFYYRYRDDLPASAREPYAAVAEAARRARARPMAGAAGTAAVGVPSPPTRRTGAAG